MSCSAVPAARICSAPLLSKVPGRRLPMAFSQDSNESFIPPEETSGYEPTCYDKIELTLPDVCTCDGGGLYRLHRVATIGGLDSRGHTRAVGGRLRVVRGYAEISPELILHLHLLDTRNADGCSCRMVILMVSARVLIALWCKRGPR